MEYYDGIDILSVHGGGRRSGDGGGDWDMATTPAPSPARPVAGTRAAGHVNTVVTARRRHEPSHHHQPSPPSETACRRHKLRRSPVALTPVLQPAAVTIPKQHSPTHQPEIQHRTRQLPASAVSHRISAAADVCLKVRLAATRLNTESRRKSTV
ncbi:hypothetical protein STAS_12692 [Striga asiatica]|uniref:Uncharacterized protein n=1 Tax=Striga asiatica TaxID=4170 RepID=A0A5A7PU50_STRAF|nr:hypothetical protein STAS_12692 [Striga asiatica]